ncbi:MAG: ATP-dependent helicase, partial [Deltaproteobacteria bacterium]|nr:ATP-dependent helicase [Deltaproteobacteria bacterium]
IVAPCGSGKCVSLDSLIFTDRGLVTAGELVRGVPVKQAAFGELEVDTSFGSAVCTAIYNGGLNETRKIRLGLGYSIEVTPEHPIRVLHKGKLLWKRADDLLIGDRVMIRRGSDVWGVSSDESSEHDDQMSISTLMFSGGMRLDALTAEICGLIIAKEPPKN